MSDWAAAQQSAANRARQAVESKTNPQWRQITSDKLWASAALANNSAAAKIPVTLRPKDRSLSDIAILLLDAMRDGEDSLDVDHLTSN